MFGWVIFIGIGLFVALYIILFQGSHDPGDDHNWKSSLDE